MSKEYIYDHDTDTYIGNMSDCLQLSRLGKHGVSVYKMALGEMLFGDTEVINPFVINMEDNMCPDTAVRIIEKFTKDAAKVRDCNSLIPLIVSMIDSFIESNTWTRSDGRMSDEVKADIREMLGYIITNKESNSWKDNITLIDIVCRKVGICIRIPQKLPLAWSVDINNYMVYIVCKNPIMMATRLAKYIRMGDVADGILPKLELTHARIAPLEVRDKEGGIIENAVLYSVIDSRFKDIVVDTNIDTYFLNSHAVLPKSEYSFCCHLKGLVLLDSIEIDDRNMAIYSIRKPGLSNTDMNMKDNVKLKILSDKISIPIKTEFGYITDLSDVTRKVMISNNENDSDLKWLRRFHKYYTIITCISCISNIISIFKKIGVRDRDKVDNKDTSIITRKEVY